MEKIIFNESDFKFIKKDEPYQDYWFKVSGKSKENLTCSCMETGMIEVAEVVYSKVDNLAAIKRLFTFSYDVIISDNDRINEDLKNTLLRKINEMEKDNTKEETNNNDLISRQAAIALAYFHGKTATWDNPTPDGVDAVDVADVAISALEKQIPKKLKTEMLQTTIQGYLYEDKCYMCPLCGIFRGNADYQPEKIIKYQFCPNCGQALDWSDGDAKEESK